jgi:hypothetical protein
VFLISKKNHIIIIQTRNVVVLYLHAEDCVYIDLYNNNIKSVYPTPIKLPLFFSYLWQVLDNQAPDKRL